MKTTSQQQQLQDLKAALIALNPRNYLQLQEEHLDFQEEHTEGGKGYAPPLISLFSPTEFQTNLSLISKEAKEVISIIFNAPEELEEFVKCSITQSSLRQYLHKKRGWKIEMIRNIFKELKELVSE